MIKINSAKIRLLFVTLVGGATAILLYNQTLWLFGKAVDSRYPWIFVPALIALLIYVFLKLRHANINDQEKLDATNKIDLGMVLNSFASGFFLFYMMLAIVSTVALIAFLIIRFFYSQ